MSWFTRLFGRPRPAPSRPIRPPPPVYGKSFNKIEGLAQLVLTGKVNLFRASYKVMLTDRKPLPTDRVYADVSAYELPTGNGYRKGGTKLANGSFVKTGDAWRLMGSLPPWRARADWERPFQYAVLYVSTGPVKALVGYWDYGYGTKLKKGSTFTFNIDPANGLFALS